MVWTPKRNDCAYQSVSSGWGRKCGRVSSVPQSKTFASLALRLVRLRSVSRSVRSLALYIPALRTRIAVAGTATRSVKAPRSVPGLATSTAKGPRDQADVDRLPRPHPNPTPKKSASGFEMVLSSDAGRSRNFRIQRAIEIQQLQLSSLIGITLPAYEARKTNVVFTFQKTRLGPRRLAANGG